MQPGAQRRVADAAARIDARPEQEAEMIGARRPVQPGDVGQRAQPDAAARLHQRQALDDEGAIEASQRRDIGDRGERDEIERQQQIGLQPLPPEAALAQRPVERDHRDEGHARRAERALPGHVVLPVGIDHDGVGQDFRRLMMIEHDHIHPEPPRLGERLETGRAAIGRDQQRRARAPPARGSPRCWGHSPR